MLIPEEEERCSVEVMELDIGLVFTILAVERNGSVKPISGLVLDV